MLSMAPRSNNCVIHFPLTAPNNGDSSSLVSGSPASEICISRSIQKISSQNWQVYSWYISKDHQRKNPLKGVVHTQGKDKKQKHQPQKQNQSIQESESIYWNKIHHHFNLHISSTSKNGLLFFLLKCTGKCLPPTSKPFKKPEQA